MIPRPLELLLSRYPRSYAKALRWTGRGNLEKRIFLTVLRRGDVIFDIGANRGHFTRMFSDLAGPDGAVEAFEPIPGTFRILEQTMKEKARYQNYRLHNSALGDASGSAILHQPGDDDGQVSLRPQTEGSWKKPRTVLQHACRIDKLDEIARPLNRLDFIKCDVEGAELLVLRGAVETLARFSPVLFLEVSASWTRAFGYQPSDLVDFLTAAGYNYLYLAEDSIRRYERGSEISRPANLLCAKTDTSSDVLEA